MLQAKQPAQQDPQSIRLTINNSHALQAVATGLLMYAVARTLRHFALDVGFESLYYPMAGLAVCARQFWGRSALYGSMLGLALALGIPATDAPTIATSSERALLAACIIAMLTGLQAISAVHALRKIAIGLATRQLHLPTALLIICGGAMLLGTVHPLTGALLIPGELPILPFRSTPALLGAWLADTLSLLMAAPVVLLWEVNRLDNERSGPARNIGVTLVAAAAATCLLSLLVYHQQVSLAQVRHEAQTVALRDELQSEMAATLHKMEAVSAYLSVHPYPSVQEYDRFANQIMRESPVLLGLGLALPVPHADRPGREALLSREYDRPITFLDYLDGGDTRVAAERAEYWPITRLVPEVRQGVIGFDEAHEPGRRHGVMDALHDGVGSSPLIRTIKRDRAHQAASFLFKYIEQPYRALILSPIHIDALLDNCPMARPLLQDGYGIELRGTDGTVLLSRNMPSAQGRSAVSNFNPVYALRLGLRSQWRLHVASPLSGLPFLREPMWWLGQTLPQLLYAVFGMFLLATTLRERAMVQLQRQFAAFSAQVGHAPAVNEGDARFDQHIQSGWEQRVFEPWFQPVVDMRTGRACGAETLLRWEQMPPGLTVPDIIVWAERHRLIRELDRHIRNRAFAKVTTHGLTRLERFSLAVNVSALELREPDFAERLLADIRAAGLPGWRVCVEITESEWMRWDEAAMAQLTGLRASGVRIALDDFGAGYSSIAYLRQLPVDRIKLDRSLVAGMTSDAKAQRIVASIVSLGETLGVEIVAEGVEDRQTMEALLKAGCHLGQGYHFSPALPIGRFVDWIR